MSSAGHGKPPTPGTAVTWQPLPTLQDWEGTSWLPPRGTAVVPPWICPCLAMSLAGPDLLASLPSLIPDLPGLCARGE